MEVKIGEIVGKVGHGIVEGCKVALCVGLISLPYLSASSSSRNRKYTTYERVNYGDAVQAVMSSDMYSHDKSKVVGLLKQNADSAYYSAVIAIVKSDMFSHEKIKSVENISK